MSTLTEYLKGRPSYKRLCKRVKKELGVELNIDELRTLKKTPEVGEDTLERLLALVNTKGNEDWAVNSVVVNRWGKNTQVKARLERRGTVLHPPVEKELSPARGQMTPGVPTVLVVPDSQNGFCGDKTTHSQEAWELTIQIASDMQPLLIVLLGDMLDFSGYSNFRTSIDIQNRTQAAINSLYGYLVRLRQMCPESKIVWLEGNHEKRLSNILMDANAELPTLTRADEKHPVMGIPHLLHLDKLRIEYIAPYGAPYFYCNIRFEHGSKWSRIGGQTVTKYLENATQSVVFGHCHKSELARKRLFRNGKSVQIFAMTPGTLAADCTPGVLEKDWHRGLGVISLVGDYTYPNIIDIHGSEAFWNGRRYIV